MAPKRLPAFLLLAPLPAAASSAGWGLATRIAWLLGAWLVLSIAFAALVGVWFRARARANERLNAEIRREDWLAAAGAEPTVSRPPAD